MDNNFKSVRAILQSVLVSLSYVESGIFVWLTGVAQALRRADSNKIFRKRIDTSN